MFHLTVFVGPDHLKYLKQEVFFCLIRSTESARDFGWMFSAAYWNVRCLFKSKSYSQLILEHDLEHGVNFIQSLYKKWTQESLRPVHIQFNPTVASVSPAHPYKCYKWRFYCFSFWRFLSKFIMNDCSTRSRWTLELDIIISFIEGIHFLAVALPQHLCILDEVSFIGRSLQTFLFSCPLNVLKS